MGRRTLLQKWRLAHRLNPWRMSEKGEVVLCGAQALDHHGLSLRYGHDFCAVAVDHKSVLAARQHPSG